MYWVLQNNLYNEPKYDELRDVLEHAGIPFSTHKVIPFIGQLEPDIDHANPVICIGTYSLRHVAKKKKWSPGVFDMVEWPHQACERWWGQYMLNADCVYYKFGEIPSEETALLTDDVVFMRPNADSKYFAGSLFTYAEIAEWQHKVCDLGEDDGTGLRSDTDVFLAKPKPIQQEIRCWILDKKVITSSIYKIGSRVSYQPNLDGDIIEFAEARAEHFPMRCYVMDVARTENGLKIIELNTMNSCGFYAADVSKLVLALEDAYKVTNFTAAEN